MSETPKDLPEFSELNDAWKSYGEKNFAQAILLAQEHANSSDTLLQHEANKVIALSHFQLREFDRSTKFFLELAKDSNNPNDHFNLATSATLNKDFDIGKKAFDNAVEMYRKSGTAENLSIPNMAFYYLHALKDAGAYEKAFEQLEFLGEIYKKLGITDTHFLYMRGVPFFEDVIKAAKEILKKIPSARAKVWVNKLMESVDEDGKNTLKQLESDLNA